MDRTVYRALLEKLTLPLSSWPHFAAIAGLFGVSYDTVFSIYSQEVQSRVLRTNHVVKAAMSRHAQRYLAGAEAVQLAFDLDFPPCVLLRRLLEALQLGLAKERITRVLRAPDQLPALVSPEALAALAGMAAAVSAAAGVEAAENGSTQLAAAAAAEQQEQAQEAAPALELALLARLQRDIEACVLCDRIYSPASDAARHTAGQEYEQRLNAELAAAGVAFWTEDQLRSKGYHKTPDARLQVPIAVQGRIVNWIDSKATFGDDKVHRHQTAEQYERYVNRFGPGLVIYWHGFIADLNKDENVLLMDRFPRANEIVQLPCLPLTVAVPPVSVGAAAAAGQPADVAAAESAGVAAAATDGEEELAAGQTAGAECTPVRPAAPSCRASSPLPRNCLESTPVRGG